MAKIRSLGLKERKQVLALLNHFYGQENEQPILKGFHSYTLPFHALNDLCPPSFKLFPSIYVALEDDQVLGLVWLAQDGHRKERWKIEQVIINPDAYAAFDVAKQLLYYVINKYGAMGVETFVARVNPHYHEGLSLLKDCGFRHSTKLHTYQWQGVRPDAIDTHISIKGLRDAHCGDSRKLQELHSETLLPEIRMSLRKAPDDLQPNLITAIGQRFKGNFYKRWVVAPGNRDYLYGSVSIETHDYKQFDLGLMVSPGWEAGLNDLLLFGLQKIYQCSSTPTIKVISYDFQRSKIEALEALGFAYSDTQEVLIKDYWAQAKDPNMLRKSPILLWTNPQGTSPA